MNLTARLNWPTALVALAALALLPATIVAEIVRVAEYYVLEAQHGERWAAEDKAIDAKLDEFRSGNGGKPPNIFYILIDDIGFGDLGISGSVTRTPNLERLAGEGVTLTNFHASPVCSVTRGMLLTGNDSIDIGLGAFDYALYPPAEGKPGYESYLNAGKI